MIYLARFCFEWILNENIRSSVQGCWLEEKLNLPLALKEKRKEKHWRQLYLFFLSRNTIVRHLESGEIEGSSSPGSFPWQNNRNSILDTYISGVISSFLSSFSNRVLLNALLLLKFELRLSLVSTCWKKKTKNVFWFCVYCWWIRTLTKAISTMLS